MSKEVVEFPSRSIGSNVDSFEKPSENAEYEAKPLNQVVSMGDLLKKLSAIGLNANYVRKAGLPGRWNNELNEIPAAVPESAAHICICLG